MQSTIWIELAPRELATILAGLRIWQWLLECKTTPVRPQVGVERLKMIHDLAANSGDPMSIDEIDVLCDRINVGGPLNGDSK